MIEEQDLGFTFQQAGSQYIIRRGGLVAATLRGQDAVRFESKIAHLEFAAQQQLMARLTGNYKRGNERQGKRRRG